MIAFVDARLGRCVTEPRIGAKRHEVATAVPAEVVEP